jgi:NAD(P)-dependent dehydrogenase (short-subunit alcohol dehydrogenase family)
MESELTQSRLVYAFSPNSSLLLIWQPIAGTVGISKLTPGGADPNYLAKLVPLQRYGTVKDIEHMTVFLASEAASYITGGIFVVDGGQWLVGSSTLYSSMYIKGKL